jgi:hypothetical protein
MLPFASTLLSVKLKFIAKGEALFYWFQATKLLPTDRTTR